MKDFIGSYYNNRFRPADNSHLGEDVPQWVYWLKILILFTCMQAMTK
jgi:hypothetical protein